MQITSGLREQKILHGMVSSPFLLLRGGARKQICFVKYVVGWLPSALGTKIMGESRFVLENLFDTLHDFGG